MSNVYCDDFDGISGFEAKLREILAEVQSKNDALEKLQTQLFASQDQSCQLQLLLENERRTVHQLRQELQGAMEVVRRLEDDKIRGQTERARLEINWDTTQAERRFLLEHTRRLKLENIELKRKVETLEAKLSEKNAINKSLEGSMNDLKQQFTALQSAMKTNIEKLKREQEQTFSAFQSLSQFHSKIEQVSHIITNSQRDKKEIHQLRQKIAALEMLQTPLDVPSVPVNPNVEAQVKEFAERLQQNNMEEKLAEICRKLSTTYVASPDTEGT